MNTWTYTPSSRYKQVHVLSCIKQKYMREHKTYTVWFIVNWSKNKYIITSKVKVPILS